MSKWKIVKLGELLEQQKKSKIKAGAGLLVGQFKFFTSSPVQSKFYNSAEYEKGLIFGTGGKASVHYCKDKFATSTDCIVFYARKDADIEYVNIILRSNMKLIEEGFKGAGLKHISKDYILNIEIPYPEEIERQAIVYQINTITNLIEKRKQQLEKFDLLVKAKFIEMFGDPVENPMGWETVKVEDICKNIMGGGTPKKSVIKYYTGEIPWVTPKDMKVKYIDDSIDKITPKAIDNSSTKLIPRNSLLMVIRSGILKRTLPLAINIKEVTINQDMKALITKDKMKSIVLYYMIKLQEKRILNNVRAVTADNIEFSVIKNMLILNPPISMQEEFSDFVYKCDKIKANIDKQMQLQQTLYKSKMQKYFG